MFELFSPKALYDVQIATNYRIQIDDVSGTISVMGDDKANIDRAITKLSNLEKIAAFICGPQPDLTSFRSDMMRNKSKQYHRKLLVKQREGERTMQRGWSSESSDSSNSIFSGTGFDTNFLDGCTYLRTWYCSQKSVASRKPGEMQRRQSTTVTASTKPMSSLPR